MKIIHSVLISFLLIGLTGFVSCSNDNDDINGDDGTTPVTNVEVANLPATSQNLLSDYFKGYQIKGAYQNGDNYDVYVASQSSSAKATVQFNEGYRIKFNAQGVWFDIEAYGETSLPEAVLTLMNEHRTILLYINREYPNRGINEIEKEGTTTYNIELAGTPEVKLIFSSVTGDYMGLDGNSSDEILYGIDKLPTDAQTFLNTHFSGLTPKKIKKDGDSYDVEYNGKTEVDFYLSGEWKEVTVEDQAIIPTSLISSLPATIGVYLNNNYQGRRIEKIENKVSIYEIEISGLSDELVFDKNGELTSKPTENTSWDSDERVTFDNLPANIKSFITTYYGADLYLTGDKDKYDYEITLTDGTEVDFDLNGNLKGIEVLPYRGYTIPLAIIENENSTVASKLASSYGNYYIEEFDIESGKNYKYQLDIRNKTNSKDDIEIKFTSAGEIYAIDVD